MRMLDPTCILSRPWDQNILAPGSHEEALEAPHARHTRQENGVSLPAQLRPNVPEQLHAPSARASRRSSLDRRNYLASLIRRPNISQDPGSPTSELVKTQRCAGARATSEVSVVPPG